MNDSEGKFWTGFFLGRMLSKNKNNGAKNNGGCFSTIIWFIILAIAVGFVIEFGIKGIVIAIVLFVVLIVFFGFRKGKNDYKEKVANEAWDLFNNGNYTLALEKAESVANDNADAATLAGILYLNGEGCDENKAKAFRFFEMGQKKNMEAKANYALMLLNGDGCQQNIELGRKELIDAAVRGKNTLAIMRFGEFQITGAFGIEKNTAEGMKKLRIAMEEDYSFAKFAVGVMQYNGVDGVPQNQEKGFALIKEAAEAGEMEAQEFLEELEK